jgi:NADH-quinone oxidoreductase subunit L
MNGPSLYLWLIPLLPFAGFLINGILGARMPKWLVTAVALLAPLASFGVVLNAAWAVRGGAVLPHAEAISYRWIDAGVLHINFGVVLDQLSLVMLLIITGVGFLIHVYSAGYMSHDNGYWRYFSYLNLFLFFMTVLVLASNALLMFVGWEGVGLASYLLIGFWFQKTSAADAGKKAFIVNRVGDFGFLIGIFLLLANFGSLSFNEVAAKLALNPGWTGGILTTICICLLIGATGKSAQLPLYVWLPDAMEGPTPVSALIHAATMVTAGVYMIARTHFLFDRSPLALLIVAIVGAATALFAATIGMVQTDIKRVLAYSTISQLGYMFLACGVAAYSAGIFHLMTHAFFKALLFLGAGSVIHGLGGEQDMRKMGGLRKEMPVTFWTMTIAVFAIAGFPPLAAFFSKDAILMAAFVQGTSGKVFWFIGLFTALLTSFYMFRLWYLTFLGKPRSPELHAHESGWSMLGPLVILALLSIVGGWIGAEKFGAFLAPAVGHATEAAGGSLEWILAGVAVIAALIGLALAHMLYRSNDGQEPLAATPGYTVLERKYWVDELYGAVIVKPIMAISRFVLEWVVEYAILGGIVWLLAGTTTLCGAILQKWQSGNLRSYAAWLAAGAAVLLLFALASWNGMLSHVGMHINLAGH